MTDSDCISHWIFRVGVEVWWPSLGLRAALMFLIKIRISLVEVWLAMVH